MESNRERNEEYETHVPEEENPLNPTPTKGSTPKGFKNKVGLLLSNITVEPIMFLFVFPTIIEAIVLQNLSLEKACRVSFNYSKEVCDGLKAQTLEAENEYEKNVQVLAGSYFGMRNLLTATVPSVIALFMGPWCDGSGKRKAFLFMVVSGHLMQNIFGILTTYFFYAIPLNVYIFVDAAIDGFSGGLCVFLATGFSFISAITTSENRTFRLGIISFCLTVGFPVGMGLSGFVLKKFGYYGAFSLTATVHVINLCYVTFVLKDPPQSKEQKEYFNGGFGNFCRTFFDLSNVKDCIQVVFKSGPNKRRIRMCVMMIVVCLLFGPLHAELSILYLSTRYRFNWDELMFSIYQAYNFITHTIGTFFSIIVFTKVLNWHDTVLGMISTASKIAGAMVYCFAINEKIFFAAPLVDILNGTAILAMRAITSKLVEANELAKVSSVLSIAENLTPLLYIPMYTKVYTSTMHFFPGLVFLIGAALTLPAFIAFAYLFYEHRKQVATNKHTKNGNIIELTT